MIIPTSSVKLNKVWNLMSAFMGSFMSSQETPPDCPKVAEFNDVITSSLYEINNLGDIAWRRLHDAVINNDVHECNRILVRNRYGTITIPGTEWINHPPRGCGRFTRAVPPLHLACMHRRPHIVKLLLKYGADPTAWDNFGRSAVWILLEYWPRIPVDCESKTRTREEMAFRTRVLHQYQRSHACLQHILDASVDLKCFVDARLNHTVLHLCSKFNIPEPMNILLVRGAALEAKDSDGRTPLLYASSLAHGRAYMELLKCGADVNAEDYCQRQSLHYLCDNTNNDHLLVEETIRRGASVNARDFSGDTPLHRAAKSGSPEQIRVLLHHGADPGMVNERGRSPLFLLLHRSEKLIVPGFLPLLMTSKTVKILDKSGDLPNLLRFRGFGAFCGRLLELSKTPPTLQRCCMVKIRNAVGIERCEAEVVNTLPLPKVLRDGVLGSEELCIISCSLNQVFQHETSRNVLDLSTRS